MSWIKLAKPLNHSQNVANIFQKFTRLVNVSILLKCIRILNLHLVDGAISFKMNLISLEIVFKSFTNTKITKRLHLLISMKQELSTNSNMNESIKHFLQRKISCSKQKTSQNGNWQQLNYQRRLKSKTIKMNASESCWRKRLRRLKSWRNNIWSFWINFTMRLFDRTNMIWSLPKRST